MGGLVVTRCWALRDQALVLVLAVSPLLGGGVVGGGAGCGVLCASFVLCLRWWVWGVGGCVLCDLNSGREHLVMHLWLVDLSAWGVLPRGWWVGWLLWCVT